MSAGSATLLLNAGSTWAMVGLIWFVQLVHYPLFDGVGPGGFAAYEARHTRQTTWVVGPLMFIELVTSVALLWVAPAGVSRWLIWAGLATVVVNWASTALLQVPQHRTLEAGYDEVATRFLVNSNWLRTAAWTAHGVIVLCMLGQLFNPLPARVTP